MKRPLYSGGLRSFWGLWGWNPKTWSGGSWALDGLASEAQNRPLTVLTSVISLVFVYYSPFGIF